MAKVIAAAGVAGALVAALVAKQSPEIRRYMKIRSM
jgi:hypothetical protein